ncbi:MAG: hypothetical protein EA353_05210 [Puniceicoccaceae bacterium]|nr:MAG: hypothetical protein EA353_05210 [Puniceicoccaceae bacterium]
MPSHKALSNWYAQLGQHLEAGMPLPETLRVCQGVSEQDRSRMADQLEQGRPFREVMSHAPKWLPRADRQFLLAGAETGALPQTLQNLSDRHATIGATQLKLAIGLAYPLFVIHIGALLLPVVGMIDLEDGLDWSPIAWLVGSLRLLLPLWLGLALLGYLAQTRHPALDYLLRWIPILRSYSRSQSLADLAYALGTFIAAGIPVPSAWRLAIKLTPDTRFNQALDRLEPCFAQGRDPSSILAELKCFPGDFVAFYKSGVESSKLDANLLSLGKRYQERANHAMTLAAVIYPTVIFLVLAAMIVISVLRMYGSYLDIFQF